MLGAARAGGVASVDGAGVPANPRGCRAPRISSPTISGSRRFGLLRAAVADPKEPNKDEALFWLAHSQNQAGDLAGVGREHPRGCSASYPKSRWSAPGRSLTDRACAEARSEGRAVVDRGAAAAARAARSTAARPAAGGPRGASSSSGSAAGTAGATCAAARDGRSRTPGAAGQRRRHPRRPRRLVRRDLRAGCATSGCRRWAG